MGYYDKYVEFDSLVGKTLTKCISTDDEVFFNVSDDEQYKLYHDQDCCESVYIESIDGDLEDLIGNPILMAEEVSEAGETGDYGDTSTWTFYKLATVKGYVTIRFFGSSNGYYSESVSFIKILPR